MRVYGPGLLIASLLVCVFPASSAKAPFDFDAMMKVLRIDDAQLSPDGKLVAFTVETVDLPNNAKPSAVYVVPFDASAPPKKLTAEGKSNSRPRWSPDGKRLFFLSDRKNGSQIWSMNPDGTDQRQLTDIPTEAGGEKVSPDGTLLLFTSEVYPGCGAGASCNRSALAEDAASKMHARVYTSLLYRHWTEYQGKRRQHLLIQPLDASGPPRDLTPGAVSVPPFSLGGSDGYSFSPDSREVTYAANTSTDLATSTNSDLFTVSVQGGTPTRITNNPGADTAPLYSPDRRYIAYRTQLRSGYESDCWLLAVLDRQSGKPKILTASLDRWTEELVWSPDSKSIFFTTDDHGTNPLLQVPVTGGEIKTVVEGPASISDVQFSPDGMTVMYLRQSGSSPTEIYRSTLKGHNEATLTHLNDPVLEPYQLTPFESIPVEGADGAKVQSFLVKPPDFQPSHKYPLLMAIHGGPEGDWGESWSYRWNAQVFAAAGYVVVLPNPHGSTGYGQAFTDTVNGDWGGRAYQDILATADYVSRLPYVDKERMAAAGGSYGGYMIDWILGHTGIFKALVSHAGVFDLTSEAGTTEELWFPKWEFRGFPWENPSLYEKWSPSSYVKNFKTPTLVTHGELDYRVPIGQGQELFTALQEMHVPSKLVQFPDEGHWILKPQNSRFWYATVIDWLNQYTH